MSKTRRKTGKKISTSLIKQVGKEIFTKEVNVEVIEENGGDKWQKFYSYKVVLNTNGMDMNLHRLKTLRGVVMEKVEDKRRLKAKLELAHLGNEEYDVVLVFTQHNKPKVKSRADRAADAKQQMADGLADLQAVMEEVEQWKDNMEGNNLENTPKFTEVQECYDALESICGDIEGYLDEIDEVQFPSMY